MKDGEIQQIGTPQDVFDHPKNLFVAGFIGMPQMNFYSGRLVKTETGDYAVSIENAKITLSDEKQKNLKAHNVPEQEITIGVRPEHITLQEIPGNMIEGRVDVSEMMGSSVHLHVNACGKDSIIIVPTLDLGSQSLKMNSKIRFTFTGNVIHVFDSNGKNLEF